MKQTTFLFLFVLALASCNQDKPAAPPQQTPAPPPAAPVPTLPSVSLELLEKIWKEATQVDYIFYNQSFTLGLSDKQSIQFAVRHVAEAPAALNPACKPTGRVSYQINGEIVLDGDFYFSTGCTYFVFEKNRVKTFANYMTDEGVKYFNDQIKQALEMQQKMQQQVQQQINQQ